MTEARLCRLCHKPISADRLEEVPVATRCENCLRPRPCERCGQMIPVDRLEAVPQTRQCMPCTRAVGEDTGLRVSIAHTRKEGSLKKGGTTASGTIGRKKRHPQ
jgi:RNA polymerase-binding transcription factor DksA